MQGIETILFCSHNAVIVSVILFEPKNIFFMMADTIHTFIQKKEETTF